MWDLLPYERGEIYVHPIHDIFSPLSIGISFLDYTCTMHKLFYKAITRLTFYVRVKLMVNINFINLYVEFHI